MQEEITFFWHKKWGATKVDFNGVSWLLTAFPQGLSKLALQKDLGPQNLRSSLLRAFKDKKINSHVCEEGEAKAPPK